MLQLLLGIAGTGKTTKMMEQMNERAGQGKQSLLLVPEQFSSTAETLVYHRLGDKKSAMVQVLSFRTLAERMLREQGNADVQLLSDAGRTVFVRRALDALGEQVRTYARHRRNTAFCAMCAETIAELKTAGATPEILKTIGKNRQEPKFEELALIYEAYEAAVENLAIDPQDMLTMAAEGETGAFFDGLHCFIDDFDGFTAPEYTLLRRVVACCESVCVALCCDGLAETEGGMGLFSPVRKTAQRLLQIAQKEGVQAKAPLVMPVQLRCEKAGPGAVNQFFATGSLPGGASASGFTLTACADEWDEIALAAAEMCRLAQSGVPYSRMALVCRDISQYQSSVRHAFGLYDIPYFTDAPSTVEYTAPVAFLRAALRIMREGLTSQPVLALLKTGLCGLGQAELAALENYVYTWEPVREEWRAPFAKNPAGLLANMDAQAQQQLEMAEGVRNYIVPLLEEFISRTRGKPAAAVCKSLYLLLSRVDAPGHADEVVRQFEERKELDLADKSRRAWDTAMGLLDQMAALLGQEKLSAAEYDDLFLLLVRNTDFGQVPQALECVLFTGADRMRLADPDYCFVVGLCDGEFPRQVGYSGLLTHADRDLLVAEGVEMPGSFANRVLLEDMFLYRALAAPRKGLYASWPQKRGSEVKNQSNAIYPLAEALKPPPLVVQDVQKAATRRAAFSLLAEDYRANTERAATLYMALRQSKTQQSEANLHLLKQVNNHAEFTVQNKEVLQRLLGGSMTLSATKAERYYECNFAYFMERVLNIKPRRKAVFSPLESGQFVHYVLEHALQESGDGFAELADEEVAALAQKYAALFIEENLPEAQHRTAHLLKRIQEATTKLLWHMRDGAKQSSFETDALELPLADVPEGVPPLEIQLAGGQTIRVTGKIDRVDVLRQNGKTYLSIVDYKTGSKSFNLEEVYCGLNMQMLIYMHTLLQNGQSRYPNAQPAAVLYLASDPLPQSGSRGEEGAPLYKMDGLVLRDEALAGALDASKSGFFIPVKYNKNGTLRNGKQLASLQKFGNIQRHVEGMLCQMAQKVYGGQFDARPLVKSANRPCAYCSYRAACRHEDGKDETQISAPDNVFEEEEGA